MTLCQQLFTQLEWFLILEDKWYFATHTKRTPRPQTTCENFNKLSRKLISASCKCPKKYALACDVSQADRTITLTLAHRFQSSAVAKYGHGLRARHWKGRQTHAYHFFAVALLFCTFQAEKTHHAMLSSVLLYSLVVSLRWSAMSEKLLYFQLLWVIDSADFPEMSLHVRVECTAFHSFSLTPCTEPS